MLKTVEEDIIFHQLAQDGAGIHPGVEMQSKPTVDSFPVLHSSELRQVTLHLDEQGVDGYLNTDMNSVRGVITATIQRSEINPDHLLGFYRQALEA